MKFLVVTGGTISGLGKGTAISSIGVVLKSYGLRVTAIKIDPYLNIDAGTMSPFEHGEVYVLEDGGEVDLDLGNYERFLDIELTSSHSMTSGKIYQQVLAKERAGKFLGKTVQMVPHVTDAIQDWIINVANTPVDGSGLRPDVCLVELGGTIGDIESAVYLEALQQLQFKVGQHNFLMVHVGFLPVIGTGEQKTKPCQHSVKLLREAGIKPDLLLCRTGREVDEGIRRKLSLFCQVPQECVISCHDAVNLYHVPMLLHGQGVGELVCKHFGFATEGKPVPVLPLLSEWLLKSKSKMGEDPRLADWELLASRLETRESDREVSIAVIGKYTGLHDSYLSVLKALRYAAAEVGVRLKVRWVESSDLEADTQQSRPEQHEAAWAEISHAEGVLVPGGFGDRGIEGKVLAANYCRTKKVPYLGICVGLQTAVIEFAREVLGLAGANSEEFDQKSPHKVVIFMPESSATVLGGTMRLGTRATVMQDPKSLGRRLYGGRELIYERHRHRYEVNPEYVERLEAKGLVFSGKDEKMERMEMIEVRDHPFFFACQSHPEFKARPASASPPFLGLMLAAAGLLEERLKEDGGALKVGAGFLKALSGGSEDTTRASSSRSVSA